MVCSNCGNALEDGKRFCRKCGIDLGNLPVVSEQNGLRQKGGASDVSVALAKDPDELTGNGIGSVIMGDGFLIVAVILSAAHTAVSSLLWLLLLIPAFFFFGKGFADVLLARQIRRRSKALSDLPAKTELSPPRASIAEVFKLHGSGELASTPGVTERTTRQLE